MVGHQANVRECLSVCVCVCVRGGCGGGGGGGGCRGNSLEHRAGADFGSDRLNPNPSMALKGRRRPRVDGGNG